ncbi:Tfp pilus assembly protein PilN [Anaerosolibacter carboniphilus]|uniref:Tfp pilus assembly protein PilN n=1 Tax=Anaerosolibacter carboniphilus TaxID=1417629 RepID=A0A841L5I8_9FIRM|nr:hypothetical protein [Anaerosolibacter carboniphilus]MBB6217679.1 Tfp pilus assembly protein PilN [Anaerosolibacter carboniphilus]
MNTDEKNLKEKQLFLGLILLWIMAVGIQLTGMMTANSQLTRQNDALMLMNQELKTQNTKITEILEELDHKVGKITERIEKEDSKDLEQDFFVKTNKRRSTIEKEPI